MKRTYAPIDEKGTPRFSKQVKGKQKMILHKKKSVEGCRESFNKDKASVIPR